jgi:integrase
MRQAADIPNKDSINADLRELQNHLFIELSNVTDSETISNEWLSTIIDKYWNPEKHLAPGRDLFSFIKAFIDKAPSRINPKSGKPVCYKMIREYERTFFYLKEYANEAKRTIDFKDIDLEFYYEFVGYLQGLNLATNTIGKKIQTLKIFLNAATDLGFNQQRHYKSPRFKSITEESQSIYLNQEELDRIYMLDLSNNQRLDRVRDLFIVGCWTGVRFSDISQITPDSIKDDLISLKQSKTGGKVVIPVHDTVQAILNKYDGTLPPIITNQKFNEYLKEVARKAKIKDDVHKAITKGGISRSKSYKKWELVTTHTGRRSFATNNYLMGVPSLTIMAITGHKTEAAFLKYIKVTPTEHADKIRQIWKSQVKLSAG